tara:strand:- start:12 stop:389 length:378 start_codon:yes stop_codon:yes gene_type:complete
MTTAGTTNEITVIGTSSIPPVTIEKFTASQNSLGEVVLNWALVDPENNIETCIVVATYQGVTAPLGAVPNIPGNKRYQYIDKILNAYVGKKEYRIVFIQYDGSAFMASSHVTYQKGTNIPVRYLR